MGQLIFLFVAGIDVSLGNDKFLNMIFSQLSAWLDPKEHSFRQDHSINLALVSLISKSVRLYLM